MKRHCLRHPTSQPVPDLCREGSTRRGPRSLHHGTRATRPVIASRVVSSASGHLSRPVALGSDMAAAAPNSATVQGRVSGPAMPPWQAAGAAAMPTMCHQATPATSRSGAPGCGDGGSQGWWGCGLRASCVLWYFNRMIICYNGHPRLKDMAISLAMKCLVHYSGRHSVPRGPASTSPGRPPSSSLQPMKHNESFLTWAFTEVSAWAGRVKSSG
jgi:hypothetical protein